MGWESISMGLNAQGEVLNNSYWTSAPEDGAMLWPQFAEGNISGSMTFYASELQYGDSTNGLVYDDNGHILYVYYNGQQVAYFGLHAYDEWISYLIFFGINEENQVGSIWIAERRMTDRWGYTIAGGRVLAGSTTQIYNTNLAYNIIKRIMPSNWKNADVEIKDVGILSGLTSNYVPEYAAEWPPSSVNYNNWREYVSPASKITVDWSKQTVINLKYGSIVFGADGYGYVQVRDNNNSIISEMRGVLYWMAGNTLYILGGIDEENQEGRIGVFLEPPYDTGTSIGWNNRSKNRQAYEFITQNALTGATIKVDYYLPNDEYTYAKITYKQNTSPIDQNDGDSVDIDPTLSSVNIEGLEEEKTYWFTIFTDKSESEAFEYTVEVDPVPPEYKPYINEINRKAFGKTSDESFILDRSIGGTIIGVNHGYGDSFVNLSGFRIEASSNTFAVYAIPYVRIDIDFDETNNRYVATGTNLVGAVGLTGPEKNYFECVANLQKPFVIRSSFKATYNINNSISPVVAISDSVIGCLQQLQGLCCYVDIYVDGTAIDIVSR